MRLTWKKYKRYLETKVCRSSFGVLIDTYTATILLSENGRCLVYVTLPNGHERWRFSGPCSLPTAKRWARAQLSALTAG